MDTEKVNFAIEDLEAKRWEQVGCDDFATCLTKDKQAKVVESDGSVQDGVVIRWHEHEHYGDLEAVIRLDSDLYYVDASGGNNLVMYMQEMGIETGKNYEEAVENYFNWRASDIEICDWCGRFIGFNCICPSPKL